MVSFGNASGPVEPFSPGILAPKGLAVFDPADPGYPYRNPGIADRGGESTV